MASYEKHSFFYRHCGNPSDVIFPVSVPEYYFSPIKTDRKLTEKEDREDKKVRQFILFCRTALKYEKLNYYNKRKHRAERETHIDILTARLEALRNPADLEHGRIYDRIMERCVPVAFSGNNYRTDKGRKNMEDAAGILRG